MSTNRNEPETLETALQELNAAENAGLFQRTSLDAQRLLARSVQPERAAAWRFALRLLPVAAAIAMAIGVGSWMFTHEPGAPLGQDTVATGPADAYAGTDGSFYECFGGPSEALATGCREYDYDADGDVDLADFGNFQLAFADTTP